MNWFRVWPHISENPDFDPEYKHDIELKFNLLKEISKKTGKPIPQAITIMVYKVIQQLKNNKAKDEAGVSAEHIKFGGLTLVETIKDIVNKILEDASIPDCLKSGIVTPVQKKGKPARQPDSLRRITVTAIIGKVLEILLLEPVQQALNPTQNPQQRGFTEHCSSTNAAYMLTEAIAEAKDHSHPLHITYMDASKAFDIVWHSTMLCKMHDRGIRDDLWLLLCNMYDGITTKIKWKGKISRPIDERQGIRQGGNISADQFKCHINPLLDRITHHNIGYQVGTIPVSAITCADDIAILSKTPSEEQVLLNVCSNDANRERYIFGESKTKHMIMDDLTNPHVHTSIQLSLNGKPVEKVQTYTHLGILRDAKPTNLASTMDRISKARRRVYSLMGAGLHGLNGLNPSISLKLWHTYIASQLYYGLEAVGATAKQLQKIEEYQSQAFRQIQHLPSKYTSYWEPYQLRDALIDDY